MGALRDRHRGLRVPPLPRQQVPHLPTDIRFEAATVSLGPAVSCEGVSSSQCAAQRR
jgi:hypothetical protein